MTARTLPPGVVMLDIAGTALTEDDRRRLAHPQVGGVILFSRNYQSPEQLIRLTQDIHALRQPSLLIAADHEGGRVQRFREGFTALPAMRELGALWNHDQARGLELAQQVGYVLAAELRARGVDLSFTPVLDIDHGRSSVIGDRAFHSDPYAISELAISLSHGLHQAGMVSIGKHFPGHGHVQADSHHELPVDPRPYSEIEATDLIPFRHMIDNGLAGIMPAHVIYSDVDERPAGFSERWLKQVLRRQLGFDGMIFSDDLSMAGASWAGDIVGRAHAALAAGCDMVLVCNDSAAADALLAGLDYAMPAVGLARLSRIHGRGHAIPQLAQDPLYLAAAAAVRGIGIKAGELPLYRA